MNAVHRLLDPRTPPDMPDGLCALAVMTKAPRAGKVKTRLTPPLTAEEAANLNTCFLRDTARAIATTEGEGLSRGIAVYLPAGAEETYAEILPAEFELIPQRGEGLGERMAMAFEDLFSLGFDSVCLIGSDSPTLPQQVFSQAAQILAEPQDQVVLGPSEDGGYYLIGLKKLHRALLENIEWSTERVLGQTLAKAGEINQPIHLLTTWYDVDDWTTLRRLCRELFSDAREPEAFPAPATRAYLNEILEREGRNRIWPEE
jgi:rSAM/selenodomain-associated transferase 1